jgi:hypothetical protein
MENNTFQKRIEEKASTRLLNDLLGASIELNRVGDLIGHDFKPLLNVSSRYMSYSNKNEVSLLNDSSKEIFNQLLPRYISSVTDEILRKVDEIDWLLNEKNQERDY